jgi:hypothetical protein
MILLYSYSIQLCSLSLLLPGPRSLCLPSWPPYPHPCLAQSLHLRPHHAKSTLVMPLSESRKCASPAAPRHSTMSPLCPRPFPLSSPCPYPLRVPWIPFPVPARHYILYIQFILKYLTLFPHPSIPYPHPQYQLPPAFIYS